MTMQKCTVCLRVLPLNDGNFDPNTVKGVMGEGNGYQKMCKRCTRATQGLSGDVARQVNYDERYDLSVGAVDRVVDYQQGVCGVCGKAPQNRRLSVNRDQETGVFLGMVCPACCAYAQQLHPERYAAYRANPPAVQVLGEHIAVPRWAKIGRVA